MEPELKTMSREDTTGSRAFSLIELLVVTAIVLLLLGAAVTSLNSVTSNAVLNRTGQSVADALILARQEAITKNRDVEVRFFQRGAGGAQAIQSWILTEDGTAQVPLSRMLTLPETVRWNTNHSPIVSADASVSGTMSIPSTPLQPYTGFRFRPDGSVAQGVGATNNYLTLQLLSEKRDPPVNFYALQVNAFNGKVSTHRP